MAKKWTAEEVETMYRLKRQGLSVREVAAAIGRSMSSVESKIEALKRNEMAQEIRRCQRREKYRKDHPRNVSFRERPETILAARPTPAMLTERDRRLNLPAPAFGDPLPGESALDRMRIERPDTVDKLS